MPKNQAEYFEEKKLISEIVPKELFVLAFGRTDDGRYVPIAVDENGTILVV